MFCPNCAAQNDVSQHFCRGCGLKLDAIVADVTAQRPSEEFAKLLRRKRRFELAGVASLSVAGIIGLSLLMANAFYYKLQIFGPELLFRSAAVALFIFAIASIFFFNYPKLFMKFDKLNPRLPVDKDEHKESATTNRLLSDPPFEPASVTEHSTELLKTPR
jgi:hypothetical protein